MTEQDSEALGCIFLLGTAFAAVGAGITWGLGAGLLTAGACFLALIAAYIYVEEMK